jgi:hypothetical protein
MDLLTRVETLEEQVRILREALPPKLRFEMALRRTRARAKRVSSSEIARVADQAVRTVRRAASRSR